MSSTNESEDRLVWYQLVNTDGSAYMDTVPTTLDVPQGYIMNQFVRKLCREDPVILGMGASQLKLYADSDALRTKNLLSGSLKIAHYNDSEASPILVVVPKNKRDNRLFEPVSQHEPTPSRKQRWMKLNQILQSNGNMKNGSTGYSSVTWPQVKSIFNPSQYEQKRRTIPLSSLKFLSKYLKYTSNSLGLVTTGTEAMRLYFISPILICVCNLFKNELQISVEEHLVGNFVKAHGRFEFMIKRGTRAICIVEAKKEGLEQGMAQDLVGCEVAAEVGGLSTVYRIVTNYLEWNFLRSLDDKVEVELLTLSLHKNRPAFWSLRAIAEKIYCMLSDD